MHLSIIVPTLNESAHIVTTLTHLQRMRDKGAEVILVDGGSSDNSRELATPLVDSVLTSQPGRAVQMNTGAAQATGEALLFLHADSHLSGDADQAVFESLTERQFHWGRFDVGITGSHFMLPVIAWFMNRRSRLTGIATGDQGLFMTRAAYDECGGFPEQPLMEDIAICKRLKKIGAPACLHEKIVTSGRRWEKHGVWKTIVLMWWLRLRYFLGATPEEIHRAYYGK